MVVVASVIATFGSLTLLVAVIILFVTLFLIPLFLFIRHLLYRFLFPSFRDAHHLFNYERTMHAGE